MQINVEVINANSSCESMNELSASWANAAKTKTVCNLRQCIMETHPLKCAGQRHRAPPPQNH